MSSSVSHSSGWGAYYLGMDYPIRFVVFGLAFIGAAYGMKLYPVTEPMWSTMRIFGMLYLFIALWILCAASMNSYTTKLT